MTTRVIGLLGVPTSAGAHWPGQEQAPRALRDAGLVEALQATGLTVIDHGDLPRVRFQPDPGQHPQNLAAVLKVARDVAEAVETMVRAGEIPLVLGGDCTIELGVIAGCLRAGVDPGLLYLDGGVDLFTPATNPTGILDSMGIAHIVAEPGIAEDLARIGPRCPLLTDERIVLFGYEPNPPEVPVLERRSMARFPAAEVRGRPEACARQALVRLSAVSQWFIVHFDVDVIDFVDFPIADVPQHNAGLTFDEAMRSLGVFAAHANWGGLVITEFNPDHADEEGALAGRFTRSLADALRPARE